MQNIVIRVGDDFSRRVVLRKKGLQFNIPNTATVTARIVSKLKGTELLSEKVQLFGSPGADWVRSIVTLVFASEDTATLEAASAVRIILKVDDAGDIFSVEIPATIK